MYRAIVRHVARRTFRHLSEGKLEHFTSVFGPESLFCFAGDHEFGGELRGRDAISDLFARMLHLFPGLEVEPVAMVINGWPWNTTVATRLTVRATLPDGTLYRNEGMQYLRLRWGRVVEDRIYEDTEALRRALDVVSARA